VRINSVDHGFKRTDLNQNRVGVAYVLRGPATAQEAGAAQGTPLNRAA
jgi:hypothetical protein